MGREERVDENQILPVMFTVGFIEVKLITFLCVRRIAR